MMDLVPSCKEKLIYFRIKELKDVLSQLGLSKQGKKQDLVDRILAVLSDEQVSRMWPKKNVIGKEDIAKLVDDTYRKMQVSGATDLASKQSISDSSNVKPKDEIYDSFKKIRCPCGISLETEPIVQCDDSRCRVWQHIGCVLIPEKPMDGLPQIPDPFYCEICRLSRADPFWLTMGHPLNPVKLITTSVPTDGTNPLQSVDRTFQLTRADKDLLSKNEYDVQAWCILLNDKVQFRIQWPQYADLQVNGLPVRVINRPGSQLLGANGRDDGPAIAPYTKDGNNKITLTGCDARIFCLGVRIAKRRTVPQVLNLIPKESDGEDFKDALARVCRCIGGGAPTNNANSDSDLEVVADSFTINLRCPMSGSRIKISGRFKPCAHMGCFDRDTFVELNQRSRKWQCPICLKNYSLEHVIIDPYFNRITSMMHNCGEDATEIEVRPDGCWRPKLGSVNGELGQWHFPDGSLFKPNSNEDLKSKLEALKQVKEEGSSEGPTSLRIEIKRNRNGLWEVSRPEQNTISSGNALRDRFESNGQKVVPMNSSATESGREGEDASVNQEGATFDFSINGVDLDSVSPSVDPVHGFLDRNQSAPDADVIVLSDSDDDTVIVSSETVYNNPPDDGNGIMYNTTSTGPEVDPTLGENSCLGLFNSIDEIGTLWPLSPGGQTGSGFQLFGSDAGVSDSLVDLQHGSINCPTSLGGDYSLIPEASVAPSIIQDSSTGHSNPETNDGLLDNPSAFGGDDPSLQIFLPTRPSDDVLGQSDLRDPADMSNTIRSEDWISLRLGGNGLNSQQQLSSNDMNSLVDTASMLLGVNDGRSEKEGIRQRSDSPFSFPRQRRSVRPRLYLSIASDSE